MSLRGNLKRLIGVKPGPCGLKVPSFLRTLVKHPTHTAVMVGFDGQFDGIWSNLGDKHAPWIP